MVGSPIRRARKLLAAQRAAEAAGQHVGPFDYSGAAPDYLAAQAAEGAEPLPPPIEAPAPRPAPGAPAASVARPRAPDPVAPPMNDEEAAIFSELRLLALKQTLAFMKTEIEQYAPDRSKLLLKKMEIAQSVLAVGARIDPSVMRGQATDEIGEMLDQIKKAGG